MSNEWREEYKSYTTNKKELELLTNGAKSLAQSWHLQAMYNRWKSIKGIKDDTTENSGQYQSSLKEFLTEKKDIS
tara:strand:- start:4089 stop:4313 length:225 start_codon:yes stop_codon:yes gene_type:complete